MKILIACEESQVVTIAFRDLGYEAYSCDIIECSGGHPEWHIRGDVVDVLDGGWSAVIAFPPCTYLTVAGIRWFNEAMYGAAAVGRKRKRIEAVEFVKKIWESCEVVAIENPLGFLGGLWRRHSQIIQPYQFGDAESKRTCLWLKNLPKLVPTDIVGPTVHGIMKNGPHAGEPIYYHSHLSGSNSDRAKKRSKTFPGIAKAMGAQWGPWIEAGNRLEKQWGLFDAKIL